MSISLEFDVMIAVLRILQISVSKYLIENVKHMLSKIF